MHTSVSQFQAMDAAHVAINASQVFGNGTLNSLHFGSSVAVPSCGINLPSNSINGARMSFTVVLVGVTFDQAGNAERNLGYDSCYSNTYTLNFLC